MSKASDESEPIRFDRPPIEGESVPDYLFRAQILNVVDGDTVDVLIDLGFEQYTIERVRIADIDTRETSFVDHDSSEYERGMAHTEYVNTFVQTSQSDEWLFNEWSFFLYSHEYERGAYKRIIGDLYSRKLSEWLGESVINALDDVEQYD